MINTFLSHFSKREKWVFYGAVIVVLLVFLDRLIFSPVASKIKSLDEEIAAKEATIRNNIAILEQKERIKNEENKYISYLGKKKLSEEEEMAALLKEVEGTTKDFSLKVIDIKPGEVKTTPVSEEYLVSLDCEANMEEITKFVYNIEYAKKCLSIKKFDISPASEGSNVARCHLIISKIVITGP